MNIKVNYQFLMQINSLVKHKQTRILLLISFKKSKRLKLYKKAAALAVSDFHYLFLKYAFTT